jgi:hypothetical protein
MDRTAKSITDYRAKIAQYGGPQIPSRYKVSFSFRGVDEIKTYYPESISLPARAFNVTPFSYWGPDYLIPSKRDYGECAMSFIIMQDWEERRYFEKWMDNVITVKGRGGRTPGLTSSSFGSLFGIIPDVFPSQAGTSDVNQSEYPDIAMPYEKFAGTIGIQCLNTEHNKGPNAIFTLHDAYPTTITTTNLAAEANSYGTFVVVFSFRYYTMI